MIPTDDDESDMNEPLTEVVDTAGRQRELAAAGKTSIDIMVALIGDEKAACVVQDLMDAETPQGRPDYRARAEGAKLYYAYREGKPIERQQIVKVTRTEAPPMEQLAESPAGLEALARLLAKVPGGREAFQAAAGG